jgi:hypothetical protein
MARTSDTASEGGRPRRALLGGAIIVLLALLKLSIHLLTAANYGYFRDELYYVDAGKHLALGYVDFPPLVALVAALTTGCSATRFSPCTSSPRWPAPRWWR